MTVILRFEERTNGGLAVEDLDMEVDTSDMPICDLSELNSIVPSSTMASPIG